MRTLIVSLTAIAGLCTAATSSAATYRVAWYNIQSGNGEHALTGHTTPFVENTNCIDSTQPLNAWGTGFVQAELEASIGGDSAVIALGLAEAWRCGTPENVRRSLNWKARTGERNGTAIVARHGFSGAEQWTELDTSLNLNTKDTMWVVRVPVCVDAACSASVIVYASHWLGTGPNERLTYFELSFYALAGEPYRLWFRARADANHWTNDSVYVQFDEAVAESGASLYRIGTTSATTLVLEDASSAVPDGWGWQDNGYGAGVLGPSIRFARTGMHTLRVQTREDGLAIDQLVLSAGWYLFLPPGLPRHDSTILP